MTPMNRQGSAAFAPRPDRGRFRLLKRAAFGRLALLLGPGLITASAGNDAGGIVTYAQAGAQWKYDFIWLMILITVSLILVQEMCARMGAVTQKGLVDLIRERFGPRLTLFAIIAILIANGGTVVSEFAGGVAAMETFHVSRYVTVPLMGIGLWWLVVRGSYFKVERVFVLLSLVFLVYIPAAILAHPDWKEVARAAVTPRFYWHTNGYILAFIALIGTTITPYMQIMLQSSVVEKGVTAEEYPRTERWDTVMGCIFSNVVSVCIIVATARALFTHPGQTQIDSAAQASSALAPAVGTLCAGLFATGLLGASLLAGAVLPLSTAFSICEAIGWQSGVGSSYRDAAAFYIIFTGLLVIGAVVALIPGIDPTRLLILVQAVEGIILPVILIFVMLLINDREIMPQLRNGPVFNFLAWTTTVVVSIVAVGYVVMNNILPLFGIKFG